MRKTNDHTTDDKAGFGLDGQFIIEHRRNGEVIHTQECGNLVVDEGLTHALDVIFNSAGQITAWYIGIFETDYTIAADDTAANISSRSVESTAYDEGVRQTFQSASAASNAVTNSANRAVFTMNDTKIIYGMFLSSSSAKNSTLGTLMSSVKFTQARSVISGDEILVTYTMTAQDV